MWEALVHSIFGDKNKGWQKELRCCYFMCPSNQPIVGAYPAKMRFIEKVNPTVYRYRCKHCGCTMTVSVEVAENGQETWRINPSVVAGAPSYKWRR